MWSRDFGCHHSMPRTEWRPTPRWLQWFGAPPYRRQVHENWMIGGGLAGYEYADELPAEGGPSTMTPKDGE